MATITLVPADRVGDPKPVRVEREAPLSTEELSRPHMLLPGREYLLLEGPLRALPRLLGGPGGMQQSPNLFWPADRAWCVASEVDFDSTLVGASARAIREILETPGLDAWPVEPADSLAADADLINRVPSSRPPA
jgi:hypothetical protein